LVSGTDVSWVSIVWGPPFRSIIDLIRPLVMLVAIIRLEFSWLTKKNSDGGGGKKKKSWIPRVRKAKATHSERTSERIEARLPRIAKLLVREAHSPRHTDLRRLFLIGYPFSYL
jgi:hypothetical protein